MKMCFINLRLLIEDTETAMKAVIADLAKNGVVKTFAVAKEKK